MKSTMSGDFASTTHGKRMATDASELATRAHSLLTQRAGPSLWSCTTPAAVLECLRSDDPAVGLEIASAVHAALTVVQVRLVLIDDRRQGLPITLHDGLAKEDRVVALCAGLPGAAHLQPRARPVSFMPAPPPPPLTKTWAAAAAAAPSRALAFAAARDLAVSHSDPWDGTFRIVHAAPPRYWQPAGVEESRRLEAAAAWAELRKCCLGGVTEHLLHALDQRRRYTQIIMQYVGDAEAADLFETISAVIWQVDPAGLDYGENFDEYDSYAARLLPRLKRCRSEAAVRVAVDDVFWPLREPGLDASEQSHQRVAAALWKVRSIHPAFSSALFSWRALRLGERDGDRPRSVLVKFQAHTRAVMAMCALGRRATARLAALAPGGSEYQRAKAEFERLAGPVPVCS